MTTDPGSKPYAKPWLTIVGVGEDGPDGLSSASCEALRSAEVVIGADRHLAVAGEIKGERIAWPVPFADGVEKLLALRGRRVVMLASGNPFWYGAGSVVTQHLSEDEWQVLPAPSVFSLAAARLGWSLEKTGCFGLHAAPFARLRPHLAKGTRAIVLVRDGKAVGCLAKYLAGAGFGGSKMHVLEALGGPRERVRQSMADEMTFDDVAHPVAVGIVFEGDGTPVPRVSGLPDDLFEHDGQITKHQVRALTMSALAPVAGEHLWDVGAGSGSISIEWLLSHPSCRATAIEAHPDRAARARRNAAQLGVDHLRVVNGEAPEALAGLEHPDAVFIGGGLSQELVDVLWRQLEPGCRVVVNAVTLESEALLAAWHARVGGSLTKISLSEAGPLGSKRGWQTAYPVTQWSVRR